MSPVSVLPVFFSLLIAFITLYALTKIFRKQTAPVRFLSIDGLRGYLAFFVFLHHACIYFFSLKTYVWELPPSNLYLHFGLTSVCLFFMVTSFLFFTKLIDNYKKKIDWLKFFVSRILRLYPLYIVAFIISLLFVGIVSHFKLNETGRQLAEEIGHWFLFSVFAQPNINAVEDTRSFMLSVLWSLKYEWLFYLALPTIGLLFFRSKPSVLALLITIGIAYLLLDLTYWFWYILPAFSGGIVAAFAARHERFCRLAAHKFSSILIVSIVSVAVIFFDTPYKTVPLILLSLGFIGIAGGNDLFGILTHQLSRGLGQLSYGIYLLHGLFLYALFHFFIEREQSAGLSTVSYWLVVSGLGAILVACCFFLHYYLELPAIKSSSRITNFLRKKLTFANRPVVKAAE